MTINGINNLNKIVKIIKPYVDKNVCLLLNGPMGAGKTTFTKVLLKELGVKEIVNSPTFIILNQYKTDTLIINHIDAYRLDSIEESEMYLEQFFDSFNVIEWGENLQMDLKKYFKVIEIKLNILGENSRKFEVKELN